MNAIDPKAFEFALSKVEDGFIFEKFAQDFLSKVLGYEFIPAGGVKDRGIDGFEHAFTRDRAARNIYQISIEKDFRGKLEASLKKLRDNQIQFDVLYYVTNQSFTDKDTVIDELFQTYKIPVHIYDLSWLSANANKSDGTIQAFRTFVDSYLHEFSKPGKSYVVGDLVADPRLFVFLRQQWEANRSNLKLDTILADTLILYSLEETDPAKCLFKTQEQVRSSIAKLIKFEPKLINELIDQRLVALSAKPNRINYHKKEEGYCLPYETRLEIENRNLRDAALYDAFKVQMEKRLKSYLTDASVRVSDCLKLMETSVNQIFYQQGLEFTQFISGGENKDAFEKRLPDVVASIVDSSSVVLKNREAVKTALLITIRDLVYNGSREEKEFLHRLSSTYMMLFLLQCDPKLATFFGTMAGRLKVYVCTSIIIPALSEIYLEPYNRRHWNLLKGAYNAGVQLIVNQGIIEELASHFKMIQNHYNEFYKMSEDLYLSDDIQTLYIDEVMIRAYFYAKRRQKVPHFDAFLDNFTSPTLDQSEEDLTEWLKHEFGMRFVSDQSLGIKLDKNSVEQITDLLKETKRHDVKARTDARMILTIHALRRKNNETDKAGIFGYQTWWLSTDTTTQKALATAMKKKYKVGCYIRPDFLYNYISLSPTKSEVDAAYTELFPSMLGVNISFHLPEEVLKFIHQTVREHASKNPARLKAALRELAEKLKVDPTARTRNFVQSYFQSQLEEVVKR